MRLSTASDSRRPAKGSLDGSRQHRVRRHGLAHERQRIGPSAERPYRVREKKRFHIDDPIPEALVDGGMAESVTPIAYVSWRCFG
jgi:hypothetical protein